MIMSGLQKTLLREKTRGKWHRKDLILCTRLDFFFSKNRGLPETSAPSYKWLLYGFIIHLWMFLWILKLYIANPCDVCECRFLTHIQPGNPGWVDWLYHWIWPWAEPHRRRGHSPQLQCPTTPGSHYHSVTCHSSVTGLYSGNHLHYLQDSQSAVLINRHFEVWIANINASFQSEIITL